MGFLGFGRKNRGDGEPSPRDQRREVDEYLSNWVTARRGVELFVEPRTTVNPTTVLLVAHDGEFTRRPVRDPQAAQNFAREAGLPIYDATVVGYPQRMRDYSRKQKLLEKRARDADYDEERGRGVL